MKVFIDRASMYGEETKNIPTDYCNLIEEKDLLLDGSHISSKWYVSVDTIEGFGTTLGELMLGLEIHEGEGLLFRHNPKLQHASITIYDKY